jgi:hypothetical protein
MRVVGGLFLGGTIWVFFSFADSILTEMAKFEIAVWLVGLNSAQYFHSWPDTFAKVFDRVFGKKHLSWGCFGRSCLATLTACIICSVGLSAYIHPVYVPFPGEPSRNPSVLEAPLLGVIAAVFLCVFDYVSLLETRFALGLLRRWSSWYIVLIVLVADVFVTGMTGGLPADLQLGLTLHPYREYSQTIAKDQALSVSLKKDLEKEQLDLLKMEPKMPEIENRLHELWDEVSELRGRLNEEQREIEIRGQIDDLEKKREEFRTRKNHVTLLEKQIAAEDKNIASGYFKKILLLPVLSLWLPTFFTSIWLWLYAGSGFLLKAARRFDTGFDWFNRKFDIEKKPLQSIGFVSGSIVAVIYWSVALLHRGR